MEDLFTDVSDSRLSTKSLLRRFIELPGGERFGEDDRRPSSDYLRLIDLLLSTSW